MKIADRCFTGAIVLPALFLLCSCATDRDQVEGRRAPEEQSTGLVNEYNNHQAEGGNPMNANLMMLDARINAANGHYKTVLITIADKQTNARITTSGSELEQLNSELAQLYKDRRATEEQITGLVNEYNNHQAEGGNRMNANLMMLDARINAANGHYKTVLITIADKQINSRITTSKSELEQLNSDLAQLYKDRRATEEQITGLANEYNTALKNH